MTENEILQASIQQYDKNTIYNQQKYLDLQTEYKNYQKKYQSLVEQQQELQIKSQHLYQSNQQLYQDKIVLEKKLSSLTNENFQKKFEKKILI